MEIPVPYTRISDRTVVLAKSTADTTLAGPGLLTPQMPRPNKRVYEITDTGRAEAARRIEEAGGPPWAQAAADGPAPWALRESIGMLALAAKQVAMAGNKEQVEKATAILTDARKKLYQLLSED